jgi:glutamine amidotransferase PdxT
VILPPLVFPAPGYYPPRQRRKSFSTLTIGIFIRAPGVVSIDDPTTVEILSTLQTGPSEFVPVALRQKNLMVTSFHPELTQDLRFHQYFVDIILENC